MGKSFIKLERVKHGDIYINTDHIIAMQPTDDAWFKQTSVRTYISLTLPLSSCEVKETIEEIIELIKNAENEVQI